MRQRKYQRRPFLELAFLLGALGIVARVAGEPELGLALFLVAAPLPLLHLARRYLSVSSRYLSRVPVSGFGPRYEFYLSSCRRRTSTRRTREGENAPQNSGLSHRRF